MKAPPQDIGLAWEVGSRTGSPNVYGSQVIVEHTWQKGQIISTLALDDESFRAWVEGIDPVTGEHRGGRRGTSERQSVRFVEFNVNNPKSLSIVASQNPEIATVLDAVLDRQADAISAYLSRTSVTRIGKRGSQEHLGDLALSVTRARHMTSREGDPHRHLHLMVNCRVRTPNGTWRGLDTTVTMRQIAVVHAIGERVLATDSELATTLAKHGYTLGRDGEINEARDAVAAMSKRDRQIVANQNRIETQWRASHPGEEPTQRLVNSWHEQAWREGRPGKPKTQESPAELQERVRLELAEGGWDFTPGAHKAIELTRIDPETIDPDAIAARAVAALGRARSAWSDIDLDAAVEIAASATGARGGPEELASLVLASRERASERCMSLADETESIRITARHLSSAAVIGADMRLAEGLDRAADRGVGAPGDAVILAACVEAGLNEGQTEAASRIASQRGLEVVIGAAGTGKTTMASVLSDRLGEQGRVLRVGSPTRKGARVLADEIGANEADSVAAWLFDHGWRWSNTDRHRLAVGEIDPASGQVYQGPKNPITSRDVLLVDEAGMLGVDEAGDLFELSHETGASVRLMGDPRQLGAVGRGGVMADAARRVEPVELDEVHRFLRVLAADEMGGSALVTDHAYGAWSKELRAGIDPEALAAAMLERGQVIIHDSEQRALAAIAAEVRDTSGEPGAVAITASTNDQARALSDAVRAERITAGLVDTSVEARGRRGCRIGVGDRVATRQNDREAGVANRDTWSVDAIRDDGSIDVHDAKRTVTLGAEYVAAHVELAYATTAHGQQGVTAERSVSFVSEATDAPALYVMATRGRQENTVHVVAKDREQAGDLIAGAIGRDRNDRGLSAARDALALEAGKPTEQMLAQAAIEVLKAQTMMRRLQVDQAREANRSGAGSTESERIRERRAAVSAWSADFEQWRHGLGDDDQERLAKMIKTEQRKAAKQLAAQQALLQEQQQDMVVQPDMPGIER